MPYLIMVGSALLMQSPLLLHYYKVNATALILSVKSYTKDLNEAMFLHRVLVASLENIMSID